MRKGLVIFNEFLEREREKRVDKRLEKRNISDLTYQL